MTAPLILTGARGFIGRAVLNCFGDRCIPWDPRIKQGINLRSGTGILLHCANAHFSKRANRRLTETVLDFALARQVRHSYFFMTFATLTGKRTTRDLNLGFCPVRFDDYTAGKLSQERLVDAVARRNHMSITFVYLPAVLGPGGQWDRLLDQARRAEVCRLPKNPAFNHCSINDVLAFLASDLEIAQTRLGIRRVVLNNPLSAEQGISALLDSPSGRIEEYNAMPLGKRVFVALLNNRFGVPLYATLRTLRTLLNGRDAPPEAHFQLKLFQFSPFYAWLLQEQGFIPPTIDLPWTHNTRPH